MTYTEDYQFFRKKISKKFFEMILDENIDDNNKIIQDLPIDEIQQFFNNDVNFAIQWFNDNIITYDEYKKEKEEKEKQIEYIKNKYKQH